MRWPSSLVGLGLLVAGVVEAQYPGTAPRVDCDPAYTVIDPDTGSIWQFSMLVARPKGTWATTFSFPSPARCVEARNAVVDAVQRVRDSKASVTTGDCR